jgi:hypothetical protein
MMQTPGVAMQDDALSGYRAFVKIVPMRLNENHLMYIRKIHEAASLVFVAMGSVHNAWATIMFTIRW